MLHEPSGLIARTAPRWSRKRAPRGGDRLPGADEERVRVPCLIARSGGIIVALSFEYSLVLWTCITYDYNTVLICALNLLRREPKVEMSTSPADGCETDAKPRAGTYEHSLVARRKQ